MVCEVGSCCCLPLLPQIVCDIFAITYRPYFWVQYFIYPCSNPCTHQPISTSWSPVKFECITWNHLFSLSSLWSTLLLPDEIHCHIVSSSSLTSLFVHAISLTLSMSFSLLSVTLSSSLSSPELEQINTGSGPLFSAAEEHLFSVGHRSGEKYHFKFGGSPGRLETFIFMVKGYISILVCSQFWASNLDIIMLAKKSLVESKVQRAYIRIRGWAL